MGEHAHMETFILWSALVWTFKGLLLTWRFFWVSPYHAIKASPREPHGTGHGYQRTGRLRLKVPLPQRVSAAEEDILTLKNQLNSHRETWERRFHKLHRRQQELRNQLASDTWVRSGIYLKQEGIHVPRELLFEAMLENGPLGPFDERDQEETRFPSSLRKHDMMMTATADQNSHKSSSSVCDSRPPSALSANTNTSVGSWRSGSAPPQRVFVPHSPLDLQLGHRVRVLLSSGRISTGVLRFLGPLEGSGSGSGSAGYHLGVELERADNGSQAGVHQGQHYFECMPGHGAFVPFHKLLMAWE